MSKLSLALLVSLLPCTASAFEGVLHVKATISQMGTIESKVHLRENGDMRADTTMPMVNMAVSMIRKKGATTAVQLMHAQKEYMEMPAPPEGAPGAGPNVDDFELKKIGKEVVNGYASEHVQLVAKKGTGTIDMWVSKDLGIGDASQAMSQDAGMGAQLVAALKKKGVDGYPMKIAMKQGGQEMVVETVKVEKRKLPADLFEIPKTYKKTEAPMMPGMPGMPPSGPQPK
jgi:hypothetical protein